MNEEKKMNDDFEMLDFEEATDDEDIETLDETDNNSEEIKGTIFDNDSAQNDNKLQNQNTEGTVIDVNRLFDVHEKEEQIAEEEIKKEEEKQKSYVPTLKPEVMTPSVKVQNRGFADALILTIIVLVYAAIIINLILKLK